MATYLDYAPTNTGAPNCYTSCFERLGFKITASTFLKREMLLDHLKAHVDNSNYIVLRSTDNEAAFMVMVSEFIVEHGEDYWGRIGREHLAEPDIFKGYLYPRDANLKGSRLLAALRNLFDYKANTRFRYLLIRHGLNWINKNIDYKAMTGRKADASHHSLVVPCRKVKSTKRPEAGSTAMRESSEEHTSDSEPPRLHKRRRSQPQQLTAPHAPSATLSALISPPLTNLSSSPEKELPKQKTGDNTLNPTEEKTSFMTEIDPANTKGEPLCVAHRTKTVLLVEASNDSKAPITVPFAAWKTSEELFTSLIREQGLRPELGKKVKQISATYSWNKRRHGLRRGREDDWDRFCNTVQKGWEMEADRFEEECEIGMVLHVDG